MVLDKHFGGPRVAQAPDGPDAKWMLGYRPEPANDLTFAPEQANWAALTCHGPTILPQMTDDQEPAC